MALVSVSDATVGWWAADLDACTCLFEDLGLTLPCMARPVVDVALQGGERVCNVGTRTTCIVMSSMWLSRQQSTAGLSTSRTILQDWGAVDVCEGKMALRLPACNRDGRPDTQLFRT